MRRQKQAKASETLRRKATECSRDRKAETRNGEAKHLGQSHETQKHGEEAVIGGRSDRDK
jgi:hypothetical protein